MKVLFVNCIQINKLMKINFVIFFIEITLCVLAIFNKFDLAPLYYVLSSICRMKKIKSKVLGKMFNLKTFELQKNFQTYFEIRLIIFDTE